MKKLFVITIAFLCFFIGIHPVSAAKARVKKTAAKATPTSVSYSSAKISRATNSVVLTLTNLSSAAKVSYELSYSANGIPQGAMGSIAITGQATDGRDLYFGTCSHGVCTPHTNIKNATLLVRTQLKTGGTYTKRYTIKL